MIRAKSSILVVIRELITSPGARFSGLSGSISGAVISYVSQDEDVSRSDILQQVFPFIVKGQLSRISGSQFLKWLFGPGKFTGLSRKICKLLVLRIVIRESLINFCEN